MAEPAQFPQSSNKPLPMFQAAVRGRVANVRQQTFQGIGKVFLTVLRLPAVDEFSYPATIEVRSERSIGKKDDEVEGAVVIGGYSDSWERTDKQTGEVEVIPTARINLVWVE